MGLPASCYQWGGLSPGAGRDLSKASYDPTGMQFYTLTSLSSVSINSTLSPTRDWLSRGGACSNSSNVEGKEADRSPEHPLL